MQNSIRQNLFIILIFGAIIPVILAVVLINSITVDWSSYQKISNERTQEQTKFAVIHALRKIEALGETIKQSPELVNFMQTSDDLREYSSNLLFGKIHDVFKTSPEIIDLELINNKGGVLFQKEAPANFGAQPVEKDGFSILKQGERQFLIYQKSLYYDDLNQESYSATRKGCLLLKISFHEILSNILGLIDVALPEGDGDISNLNVSVSGEKLETKRIALKYILLMVLLLLSSLIVGLFLFSKRILSPIQDLTLFVRSQMVSYKESRHKNELELLKTAFHQYVEEKKAIQTQLIEKANLEALAKQAAQVAHDIRSPLAALDVVVNQTTELPEENRLLVRRAVQRIRDIANDLSQKRNVTPTHSDPQTPNDGSSVQLLSGLVDTLVSEKRLQYRDRLGIEIEPLLNESSYGLFAAIQPVEFKRVLSNLINNAVEALANNGKAEVKLSGGDNISIQIADNGKGIPPEILPRLMQRGETHGKAGGSGLGLYHSRTTIEKWGGTVEIESTIGKGTTITITLSKAEAPSWFVENINLSENTVVVVIDDDASIHQIWKKRFENETRCHGVRLIHFSSPEEFSHWYVTGRIHGNTPHLYLCDYEFLNHNKTGLDIIRNLGLANEAILVTSRFEEDQVRSVCEDLGVRMIPKNLAGFVPIHVAPASTNKRPPIPQERREIPDAVLIDDDDLVHTNWKLAAKRKNKIVRVYAKPDDFFSDLPSFSTDIPVYIDSNLSDGVNGETVAKKLKIKGFDNLYLATGYEAAQFEAMPWIKGIVGKNPPWA